MADIEPKDILSIPSQSMSDEILACLRDTECDLGNCQYHDLDEIRNIEHGMYALHLNVHGLVSKIDDLKNIIVTLRENMVKIDFILLCETFLKDNNQCFCNIDGYQLVCKNRQTSCKGGVALYIANEYTFVERTDIIKNYEGEFESTFSLKSPISLIKQLWVKFIVFQIQVSLLLLRDIR